MKFLSAIVGLVMLAMSGCGYTTQGMIPPGIDRIAIPMFKNETFRLTKTGRAFKRDIEKVVTDAVIEDFLNDGRLQVVDRSKAQWLLEGSVIGYETEPLRYSRFDADVVEEIRVVITISLTLTDVQTGQVLWSQEKVSREEDFYVSGSIFDEEESALRQAADKIAKDILVQVIEGWY